VPPAEPSCPPPKSPGYEYDADGEVATPIETNDNNDNEAASYDAHGNDDKGNDLKTEDGNDGSLAAIVYFE